MTARTTSPGVRPSARLRAKARQAVWAAARTAFPPRPVLADWPATDRDRDEVLDVLASPPFVMAHPGSQRGRLRGIRHAVDWLAAQPGTSWQQRWHASGAESYSS